MPRYGIEIYGAVISKSMRDVDTHALRIILNMFHKTTKTSSFPTMQTTHSFMLDFIGITLGTSCSLYIAQHLRLLGHHVLPCVITHRSIWVRLSSKVNQFPDYPSFSPLKLAI